MKRFIAACLSAVLFSGSAAAQCADYQYNLERAFKDYKYYSSQYPIVSSAFDSVMSEYISMIKNNPDMWSDPNSFTFEDMAPALGSMVAFALVCNANQPHCDNFGYKIEPLMKSIMTNMSSGYSAHCWN